MNLQAPSCSDAIFVSSFSPLAEKARRPRWSGARSPTVIDLRRRATKRLRILCAHSAGQRRLSLTHYLVAERGYSARALASLIARIVDPQPNVVAMRGQG